MKKNNLMFLDAEADGLYGTFLSVAAIVTDAEGREIERVYYGINLDNYEVKDEWVKENVEPFMGKYEMCDEEDVLLGKVWRFWEKYKEDTYCIVDVSYPVESRLFQACVKKDPENRKKEAPFPLLDLSSMLFVKGINPLEERERLAEMKKSGVRHNALYDTELSVEIWKQVIMKDAGGQSNVCNSNIRHE